MNKKIIIVCSFILSFFTSSDIFSQLNFQWVRFHNSGTGLSNQEARSLCIDDNFNVNVAGAGDGNVYKILKYDIYGNLRWNYFYPDGTANKIIFNGNDNYFISGSNGLLKLTSLGNLSLLKNGKFTDILLGQDNKIYALSDSSNKTIITDKYNLDGSILWTVYKSSSQYTLYYPWSLFMGVDNKINVMGRYVSNFLFWSEGPVYISYDTVGNLAYSGGFPLGARKGIRNDHSSHNFFAGYWDQNVWHSKILLYKVIPVIR